MTQWGEKEGYLVCYFVEGGREQSEEKRGKGGRGLSLVFSSTSTRKEEEKGEGSRRQDETPRGDALRSAQQEGKEKKASLKEEERKKVL